jgi:DNA-binding NtrC family response regulator
LLASIPTPRANAPIEQPAQLSPPGRCLAVHSAAAVSTITLDDLNLENAERRICVEALTRGGNIVNAAKLLGITRHALKRRIIKLGITWPSAPGRSDANAG